MSTITSTGLGSGIDVNNLVDTLVSAEKEAPQERIDLRKAVAESTISAMGSLKSALSQFQSLLAELDEASDFETVTASSSDTTIFSARADSTAIAGSYRIEVEQLATNNKLMSEGFAADALVGKGTMTLSLNGASFEVETGVNTTLVELRNQINNASDNTGVSATIISTDAGERLVLTSKESGADNKISVTVDDNDGLDTDNVGLSRFFFDPTDLPGSQMTQTQEALDALVRIDGELLTSASNTIEDAITGVTLALDKADDGTEYTLSLFQDTSALEEKISDLVDGYNSLLGTVNELQFGKQDEEGNVLPPLLPNDPLLRSLTAQVRRFMGDNVDSVSGYNSLASMGVSTNRDGSLSLNTSTLRNALDNGVDQVKATFSNDGEGVANRLYELVGAYIEFEGTLDSRTETAEAQLERLTAEQERLDLRIEKYQERLFAQFNYMDSVVGLLGGTTSYLEQQLSLLPFGGGLKGDK